MKICPNCSKYEKIPLRDWENPITPEREILVNPVYLVERINKKENVKFLGCPNFPKCKFSVSLETKRHWYYFDYEDECRPY